MEREIKFRAWCNGKMVDLYKITPLALSDTMNTALSIRGADGLFIPFDNETLLMQYTGLKDQNGTNIYEGDILDNGCGDICAVKFGEHLTEKGAPQGWYVEWANGLQGYLNCSWTDCGVVVGNVHENKELIKAA